MIGRLFKLHTTDQHADSVANYLPNCRLFSPSKFNATAELRKTIYGMAGELVRAERNISDQFEQRDITTTTDLIDEWESALGIPDDVFPGTGTLTERRAHCWIKFTMSVQTAGDFEGLADILGYNDVTVTPFTNWQYPPYDVPFFPQSPPENYFTALVEGTNILLSVPPYDVPFDVGGGSSVIQLLFNRLKPAHVLFIYIDKAE